jgi:hypothetical protein
VHSRSIEKWEMKKLLMALAAVVLTAICSSAHAQRLPGSNSELGCRELNAVMENSMEKGEDFLDCSKQDDANYIHLQNPKSCVRYMIMEFGSRYGYLNPYGYPPLVPYRHILRGCYRIVLGISQAEYDARCTSFCVPRPY